MIDVFISYATKDKFFAELLAKILSEEDITTWRDASSLRGGDNWREEIDLGIRQSAACILVLSEAACASHFVTYEWAYALGQSKTIIPVLLEDCERHPKIEPIQYVDLRHHTDTSWQQIVDRIKECKSELEMLEMQADEPSPELVLNQRQARAKAQIQAYLNERGFRMMSFSRIREKADKTYDDDFLEELVNATGHFASARLRGNKKGLKLI